MTQMIRPIPPPEPRAKQRQARFWLNSATGTLTFPVRPDTDWAEPVRNRALRAGFTEVRKLKYTVIGYRTARMIEDAAIDLTDDQWDKLIDQIRTLVHHATFNWVAAKDEFNRPVFWKLQRDYPCVVKRQNNKGKYVRRGRRTSIVLLIDVPGLNGFYGALEELINEALAEMGKNPIRLDRPVMHITLFVKGRCLDGIGVNSETEFEQYRTQRW